MLRAVVVDDSAVLRMLTRVLIEDDAEVIGEAENAIEALKVIQRLLPDVAIIDLHLPGMDGVELIQALRRNAASTRLVAYSGDDFALAAALRAGADAAVLKTGLSADLITALAS